jgi:fibronectin-binding autotransporter adhesin
MNAFFKLIILLIFLTSAGQKAISQKMMEKLGRSVIALNAGSNRIYVGWRLLGNDPENLGFNLYKSEGAGSFNKINASPMTIRTDTLLPGCNLATLNRFYVRPVLNGIEQEASAIFTLPVSTPVRQYVRSIPLQIHSEPGIDTSNAMPGDLDGDGELDLVVMRTGQGGDTARIMIESYKLDGTYLWRFEFGKNINLANEHNAAAYYVVYDFDGDGKSEVCVRGSERSIFQAGSANERMVGDVLLKDGITLYPLAGGLQRPSAPEYLFMLDGLTGMPLDSIKYEPAMGPAASYNTTWGGNERPYYQWMSVAYLDGKFPSVVTQRGIGEGGSWFKIYGFDFRDGKFKMRPDSLVTQEAIGFGGHSIRVKDIDNDGKDELLFNAAAVDHDMKLLYNQHNKGIGHGDGYQILDIDPDRPGMEWFAIQQNTGNFVGAYYWDAATGDILKKYYMNAPSDPSRGDAAPISPNHRGAQMYGGTQGVMDARGNYVNKQSFIPCGTVYWDADMAKELIENANSYRILTIKKYDPVTGNANILFNLDADGAGNSSMAGATYFGDLVGDWREEIVAEAIENNRLVLRIYTTTTQSNSRHYTLLHNPSYRTQLTCLGRIGGFYPDFYMGPGMSYTPPAPCFDEDVRWNGMQSQWDNKKTTSWINKAGIQTFTSGNKVLFDDYGVNGQVSNKSIQINESVEPSEVVFNIRDDYSITGAGSITGAAKLSKNGRGNLTINATQQFTGITNVWDGNLIVNDKYLSPVTVYGGVFGGYQTHGKGGGRLSGSGRFMNAVELAEKGGITPGNMSLARDTFRIHHNLLMKNRAYIVFDLGNNPNESHDIVDISGNLTIQDSVYFIINAAAGVEPGTYPLINYRGIFSGSISKINITGLENRMYNLVNTSGAIRLIIEPTRQPAEIVWGGLSNKWEKTTEKYWYLKDATQNFVANDSVIFNNSGKQQSVIQIAGNVPCSDVLVDGTSAYTFTGNGAISGKGGLTKKGTGKLTMLTNNSFSGPVKLEGGQFEIAANVYEAEPSPLGETTSSPTNFQMSDSQLRFISPIAMGFERGISIYGTDTIHTLNTVALSGLITGTGKLIKTGAGKLNLINLNNFSGGTVIKEGSITFADNNNPLGTGLITLAGGNIIFSDNSSNTETFSTPIDIPAGITAGINLDSRMVFSSTLTGAGTLNLWTPYVRADLKGNWSAFSGTINVTTDSDGGDFRITNSFGYPNAIITLGSKVNAYPNGSYVLNFGALSSTFSDAKVTTPFTVGNKNTDASFAGLISGTGAITKKGTGAWTISNANTYSGGTNIESGNLLIANTSGSATGSGTITVKSTAELGGTGAVSGSVSVMANGTLSTGNTTSTGTMTIGTNLVISKGGFLAAKLNAGINTADLFQVTGNVVLNGITLKLFRRSGTFAVGNQFKIINSSNISGNIAEIIPANPGAGLYWDLSDFYSSGMIKITDVPSAIDKEVETDIKIFPNPFTDKLTLQLPQSETFRISILNISGQLILHETNVSGPDFSVDLSTLTEGIYLIHISGKEEKYIQRIVKTHGE